MAGRVTRGRLLDFPDPVSGDEQLLAAIRRACPSALWSRGVELARDGAVVPGAVKSDEIEFQVSEAGGLRTREVSLFPEDEDWSCSCDGRFDCCEHVAAAIISLPVQ